MLYIAKRDTMFRIIYTIILIIFVIIFISIPKILSTKGNMIMLVIFGSALLSWKIIQYKGNVKKMIVDYWKAFLRYRSE